MYDSLFTGGIEIVNFTVAIFIMIGSFLIGVTSTKTVVGGIILGVIGFIISLVLDLLSIYLAFIVGITFVLMAIIYILLLMGDK